MKNCPFCAEEIQDAAIVCKHCRRDLPLDEAARLPELPSPTPSRAHPANKAIQKPWSTKKQLGVGCGISAGLIFVAMVLGVISAIMNTGVPYSGSPSSASPSSSAGTYAQPAPRVEEAPEAGAPPTTAEAASGVRSKCARDWPEDFTMRSFCEEQQLKAVKALRSRSMTSTDERTIRRKCAHDWTEDFTMREFCEAQQLKALGQLGR